MWWLAGAHDGRRRRFATFHAGVSCSFPLPAGTSIDTAVYFAQCLQWAIAQFGQPRVGTFLPRRGAPRLHLVRRWPAFDAWAAS
jgi:hypothetical protein